VTRAARLGAALFWGVLWGGVLGAGAAHAADGPLGLSTVDPTRLRVCADPANLPFSDVEGRGFENRIAERLARWLGRPLAYTWHPQSLGFVRNTLRARLCDVIIGVVAADELVQNTNPYYRSAWVLVHRQGGGDRFGDLAAPTARDARIGAVAGTPPVDLVARLGLLGSVRSYHLMTDTRVDQPGRAMLAELAEGAIDMALLWGPIAGYWADRQAVPLALVPLVGDARAGLRFDFRISMGIRQGEPEWKHQLNDALKGLQPEIDRILDEFAVPRLDARGRLVGVWADAGTPPADAVAEPAGYRPDAYRAPVPATLEGATVLDTPALVRLIAERRPVLIDVLPKARRPELRPAEQIWIEPMRQHIPGSVWLPNTGYGELPPETAAWLAAELDGLTGGDKARPLVFYCDAHCWMSWNAAKRAMTELGYTAVHWYPQGAEGWMKAGLPLVEAAAPPSSMP